MEKEKITFVRCEAAAYTYYRFNELHYLDSDSANTVSPAAACFLFSYDGEVAGFCSVINKPYKGCPEAMGINRVVVLEKHRGQGLGGYMISIIAGVYSNRGNKVYIMTESKAMGKYCETSSNWQPTATNMTYRTYNNCEGEKYKNRKDGVHYHYMYVGDNITGYEELIKPLKKMREENNKVIFNNNQMKENVNLKRKPCTTMLDVMNQARYMPEKKQLFNEFWFENELCVLFAEQGKGKTILAVQIAAELTKNDYVLYMDYEMGDRQLYKRYSDRGVEFKFNDNFLHPDNILFNNSKKTIEYIKRMCIMYDIKYVIIDNISALSNQLESSKEMTDLIMAFNKLKKEQGISILLLGHTTKRKKKEPIIDNDLAGSKKLIGLCDSSFAINSAINDDKQLYIKQIKCRECEMKYGSDNVMMCTIEKIDAFTQLVKNGCCKEEELLDKNNGRISKSEMLEMVMQLHLYGESNRSIAKKLNISEGTVRNYLKINPNEVATNGITTPPFNKSITGNAQLAN